MVIMLAVTAVPSLPNDAEPAMRARCGLGLTFREDAATGLLIVHSITPGGGADNCGTIQVRFLTKLTPPFKPKRASPGCCHIVKCRRQFYD
jgi:hypothetical protein